MFRIIVSPLRNLHIEGDHSSSGYTDLHNAFTRGSGYGLLFLDIATETIIEEESISYWRDLLAYIYHFLQPSRNLINAI